MARTTLGATGNVYKEKGREGWVIRWINAQGERKSRLVKVHSIKAAREALAAEKLRVEEELRFGRPMPTEETFEAFAMTFLAYQEKRISARVVKGKLSQSEFNRQKGIIVGHLLPFFGSKKLPSVRRKDVAEYIDMRTGVAGDGTIIKEVNVLKRMFNVAIEFEKVVSNPAQRANLPKAPEGRVRYLLPSDLGRVLSACTLYDRTSDVAEARARAGLAYLPLQQTEQWLQNFAGLSVSLGTRRGELLLARWEDVDVVHREIRLRHTKNGKERPAFINEAALLVLASMSDGTLKGRGLLFPDVKPAQVTVAFIRACKNAGITDFSLHDLRHTYASLARMNGVDLQELSKILGHSDLRMTDRYAHLSGAHLLDAARKLDGVLAQAQAEAQRASGGLPALLSA
jgi:integrase